MTNNSHQPCIIQRLSMIRILAEERKGKLLTFISMGGKDLKLDYFQNSKIYKMEELVWGMLFAFWITN